tara:strand:- start:1710 stop:2294 length:585 start_codon:yes stop_codon:yes gene_type:complete
MQGDEQSPSLPPGVEGPEIDEPEDRPLDLGLEIVEVSTRTLEPLGVPKEMLLGSGKKVASLFPLGGDLSPSVTEAADASWMKHVGEPLNRIFARFGRELHDLAAVERQTAVALFVPVSVALGKGEIRQDVANGHVPRDVASFADLHDHRDANEYGGLCNEEYLSAWGLSSATVMAVGNDIQNLLDEWIKGGGLQ